MERNASDSDRKNRETEMRRHPDIAHFVVDDKVLRLGSDERLKMALKGICIGERIRNELKAQGRTVTWLANQLCLERTSLYYTFWQNSISIELLFRISSFLGHNFLQDVADVYKAFGL